jgi:prepilin-type N-terminal cleavage/methylation domain-containing protein
MRANAAGRGFSLAEMLVACALLSLLLLSASAVHVEARRSTSLSEEVALRGQVIELASELLHYHLALAGHHGVNEPAADLGGPAMSIAAGATPGGDRMGVRYLEERWYREPEVRTLYFDVKRDSNGTWNLYQREAGATRQPAVQLVNALELVAYIAPDGSLLPSDTAPPLEARGLELELGFAWGETRRITVPFAGVQRVEPE